MKKNIFLFVVALMTTFVVFAQELPQVTIGKQIWTSQNLNIAVFRNGDPIPEVKTNEEWLQAGQNEQPAWCYYYNDSTYYGAKYGRLYNFYAVNDQRGLAPTGWHVPTDDEWTQLVDLLKGEFEAGSKLKSKTGWGNDKKNTNSSGFSAFPGGARDREGVFIDGEVNGNWWSATDYGLFGGFGRIIYPQRPYINKLTSAKICGYSVRLVKD